MTMTRIRVSLCIGKGHETEALRAKIGNEEAIVYLRPLWEQPDLLWASDVVILRSEDIASFAQVASMSFCPAILLEVNEGGAGYLEHLDRVPFATFSPDVTSADLKDLVSLAAAHTRMRLATWHARFKKSSSLPDGVLHEEPVLKLDSVLHWLKDWQDQIHLYGSMGEMFSSWSASPRVHLLASKEGGGADLEIRFSTMPKENDIKGWRWHPEEPWVQELLRSNGVILKEGASAQLFRWFEAMKVDYMIPLRHQDALLGVLAFADRKGSRFQPKDLRVLTAVVGKMGEALWLSRRAQTLASTPTPPLTGAKSEAPPSKEWLRKQQMEIIGRMAMRSSHELKNCLVSIRTFTQLFPEKYADEQFRKDFYEVVSKEVERLNALVEKLLFFAQGVHLRLSEEKVTDVISEALSLFSPDTMKHVQLHKAFGHNQPTLWLDRQQMLVVFHNIVQNSLQAMGNRGKLVIVTEDHPHAEYAEGVLAIRFMDSGRGAGLKDMEEAFEPFFSTRARGIGLGLTIARRIVEEHGGTIRMDSHKGKGTEVILCLPRKISRSKAIVDQDMVRAHP
jgi:signal transduction histidine kinase